MERLRRNTKGFTLIEMIVVIVIIAILVALAVPKVLSYVEDARDSKFLAQSRIVFNEVDLKSADYIYGDGLDGSFADRKKMAQYIKSEYDKKGDDSVKVGDYKLYTAMICAHFDNNETKNYTIDPTSDNHNMTKLGLAYINDDYTYVFVVIKRNGEAKVFHNKFGSGEAFDENSEWYIDWYWDIDKPD